MSKTKDSMNENIENRGVGTGEAGEAAASPEIKG